MASLKQTKIYGALEVYNGENKVSITVDPESFYPNGVMEIGCINIGGILIYKANDNLLALGSNIGTNTISATSLDTGSITTGSITASSMTFTGNTGTINGLKTLNFETGSTNSNNISNIHSITFDSTDYSSISNLYSLTLKPSGIINLGTNNKISIESSQTGGSYFKFYSHHPTIGGIRIGCNINGQEDYASLSYNGTNLNIDKPVTIDDGLSLQKTSISNLGTLSFSSSDSTATLLWDGTYLSINQPIKVGKIKTDSTNILISGTDDISTRATYAVAIGDNANITAAGGVAIGAEAEATAGSISIGRSSDAEGQNSIAIGSKNNASTTKYGTIASGTGSIAIGAQTSIDNIVYNGAQAYGDASIAIGVDSYTGGDYNTVLGFYSKTPSKLVNNTSGGGGGASSSTKVLKVNNSIAIGNSAAVEHPSTATSSTSDISYSIAIGASAKCTVSNSIALGYNLTCSNSSRLQIPDDWKVYAADFVKISDRLDKTNIKQLTNSYTSFLMDLKPVTYNFNYRDSYTVENPDSKFKDKYGISEYDKIEHAKGSKANKRTHIGFIAQDVKNSIEKHFPNNDHLDIINIDKMDTGEFQRGEVDSGYERYYMNYSALIPVLVKVLQEQQEEINILKSEIGKLKK